MIGYIYKAVVADKVYIGKTTGSLHARVKTHLNHAFVQKLDMKISQALRTLTEEEAYNAFSIVEEVEADDPEELENKLCERENYYMDKFNSFYPNGYNVSRSFPQIRRNGTQSQPPREKVMRPVICVETGEHYKSIADASRATGVELSAIHHCLKGRNNTAGKLHWMYADGEVNICERPEGPRNKASQSKPVMCKETGVIYPSLGEAGRQTGICWTSIGKCAHGEVISAGGYKWGFVIDGEPVFIEREDRNKTKIKCLETGEIFESATACAKSLGEKNAGTLLSTIDYGCKHKGKTYIRL